MNSLVAFAGFAGPAMVAGFAPLAGGVPPEAPGNFAVDSQAATSITVTWDAVPDGVSVRAQWQLAGGYWSSYSSEYPAVSGLAAGGLASNTAYDLRIRAEKDGLYSDWVTLSGEYTRPSTPTGLSATPDAYGLAALSWTALGAGLSANLYIISAGGSPTTGITDPTYLYGAGSGGASFTWGLSAVGDVSGLESNLSGTVDGTSGAGSAPSTGSPTQDGSETSPAFGILTCDPAAGTWDGDPAPSSFTYLWMQNGNAITGALTNSLDLGGSGIGVPDVILCQVIATNAVGYSGAVNTNSTTIIG